MRFSYSGPSADLAVLHTSDESYAEAIASGHKGTYAPEAWEIEEPKKRGPGRPPKDPQE